MQQLISTWLESIGEDPARDGLRDTPRRTTEAWAYMTRGYQQDPLAMLRSALFEATAGQMVLVRDIAIYSMCEHHLLPFFGVCHIGYIPKNHIVGVSKLARLADIFARRLQVQERLTDQIASALMEALDPEGVGVIIEARHLCMIMRGAEKQNSRMVTSAMLGSFQTTPAIRDEFLQLARLGSSA